MDVERVNILPNVLQVENGEYLTQCLAGCGRERKNQYWQQDSPAVVPSASAQVSLHGRSARGMSELSHRTEIKTE